MSDVHDKDKVFPDGEYLHATIKDTDQCITCLPIELDKVIHIKCDLGFFDECND